MLFGLVPRLLAPYSRSCLFGRASTQAVRDASSGGPSRAKQRIRKVGLEVPRQEEQYGVKKDENGRSLLEELFPEESKSNKNGALQNAQREIPRLPLDLPDELPRRRKQPPPSQPVESMTEAARRSYDYMKAQPEQIAVLVFRNASKSLIEEDFQRLIPKGRHIEGWNNEVGDIVKVIPGRDMRTLERLNHYYLLFKSPVSAFTYQGRVTRIYDLVSMHTPKDMESPIPPPPGYVTYGEDVHEQVNSYALTPPSQKPSLRQLAPPLTPMIEQLIKHRGYPDIVQRPGRAIAEVLLRLEGPQVRLHDMRMAFIRSEGERALPWTGDRIGAFNIDVWEPKEYKESTMSSRPIGKSRLEEWSSQHSMLGPSEPEKESEDVESSSIPSDPYKKDRGVPERTKEQARWKPTPSYIIGFDTAEQAYAFVRYWHRRPLNMRDKDHFNGDLPPIINAEILW